MRRNETIAVVLPRGVWDAVNDARLKVKPRTKKELLSEPMLNPDGTVVYEGLDSQNKPIPCLLYKVVEMPVLEAQSCVTSYARWFRKVIRDHHEDPIEWPDGPWLAEMGEGWAVGRTPFAGVRMVRRVVSVGPDAHGLLTARAAREAQPASTVLRRLVRQVLVV